MNLYIKAAGREWNAHTSEIFRLLGLTGSHLPKEGMPPRLIQGIKVWVNPIKWPHPLRKSSTHRVMAECPVCGKTMSAGRLHQHAKVHQQGDQA